MRIWADVGDGVCVAVAVVTVGGVGVDVVDGVGYVAAVVDSVADVNMRVVVIVDGADVCANGLAYAVVNYVCIDDGVWCGRCYRCRC